MLRLDFSVSDLNLAANREKTRRASISGVQDKVQLRRIRGGFSVVESGGDYILKPVPRNTYAEFAADIPVNESLTMDIASKVFGIKTAEHELVEMKDGEYAYLTRRFDRRGGEKVQQEDFCQLAGRTPETHGENYKYDSSYEELAGLIRRFCPAAAVENPKVFFLILFNYVFANGDVVAFLGRYVRLHGAPAAQVAPGQVLGNHIDARALFHDGVVDGNFLAGRK